MKKSRDDLTIVGLPGAGFDHTFIEQALGPLAQQLDAELMAADPQPGNVLSGYCAVCDEAAARGDFICIGISIGAIAALRWLIARQKKNSATAQGTCLAAIISMAPWCENNYADAPAALAASSTAQAINAHGFATVKNAMVNTSPPWLAELQAPCWDRLGNDLGVVMSEVSETPAPPLSELGKITDSCGFIRVTEDPLHPVHVTDQWIQAMKHGSVTSISLHDIADNVAVFSSASLLLLQQMRIVT